jgi:hypothetical protein
MRLSDFLNNILRKTGLSVGVPPNEDKCLDSPKDLDDPLICEAVKKAVEKACKAKGLSQEKAREFAGFVVDIVTGGRYDVSRNELLTNYEVAVDKKTGGELTGKRLSELEDWEKVNQHMDAIQEGFKSAFECLLKLTTSSG